jgi:hypothetical protein
MNAGWPIERGMIAFRGRIVKTGKYGLNLYCGFADVNAIYEDFISFCRPYVCSKDGMFEMYPSL